MVAHRLEHNILFSFRFLLTFLLFLAFILIFAQRTNMSIGIICMINHTAITTIPSRTFNSSLLVEKNWQTKTENLIKKCALEEINDNVNETSLLIVIYEESSRVQRNFGTISLAFHYSNVFKTEAFP